MPVLYRGERHGSTTADDVDVLCRAADGDWGFLPHVERHSPDGFNWGYGGSGPADLALSILSHYLGRDMREEPYVYQRFKAEFVARWPLDRWELDSEQLAQWCTRHSVKPEPVPEPLAIYHLRRILEHYPDVTWHEPTLSRETRGSNGDLIEPEGIELPGFWSPAGATIPSEPVYEARAWLARYDRLMPGGRELFLLERCATLLDGAATEMLRRCQTCPEDPTHEDELCTQCEAHREALTGTASHVRAFLALAHDPDGERAAGMRRHAADILGQIEAGS